jgi:DNA polymerase-3 subunit delta'
MTVTLGGVWAALTGQHHVVPALVDAAAGNSMTQSWLITGPAGSGRSVVALAFAAALQCETRSGCGHCPACEAVLARLHADLVIVTPEGLSIGIDEAKELVRRAASSPSVGRYRIVIIEDADRLTEHAENTLLKTLEEPPERTVFLLCAPSPADMLVTTASRCRQLQLRVPSSADLTAVLVGEGVDPAIAAFASRAAQGHLGRARRLATDEAARSRRADVLRLPTRLGGLADALGAAADLYEAAVEESGASFAERDLAELASLEATLSGARTTVAGGARTTTSSGGRTTTATGGRTKTGAGAGGRRGSTGAVKVRGAAGAMKELQKRQKSRTSRGIRDVLDHALVDLAAWYRDVLAMQVGADVEAVHDDQRTAMEKAARGSRPEQTLARIEAVLACRRSLLEYTGVAPQLAIESLAVQLQQARS